MKNIILAIDRVEPGLIKSCYKIEKYLGYELVGIRLVGVEYRKLSTYKPDDSGFFKEIVVDFDNPVQLQKIFKEIKNDILAVNCRDEVSIKSFRKIIPFIPDVPTPNETTLLWATEKNLMRKMFESYDSSMVPMYSEIPENKISNPSNIIKDFKFPVILKPCGLHTSMLVTKCSDINELKNALEKSYRFIHTIYEEKLGSGSPLMMVEEFIEGEMYSIDAYVKPDGKSIYCLPPVRVITSHEVGLSGFYGYEFRLPAGLNSEELEHINFATKNAIISLGLRSCTAHVELYKTKEGNWKIIELGPRIGGHREIMYRFAYGVEHYFNDLASRIAGLDVEMPEILNSYVVCIEIYPDSDGEVTEIHGLDEVKKLHNLVELRQLVNVGDLVNTAENGGVYCVDVVLAGNDETSVRDDARKVHKMLKLSIRSHQG
jgi:hypothetical protein